MNSRLAPANFALPQLFSECKAATRRDAGDEETSGPNNIITKLHINWGREGDVVSQRDACGAFEEEPHIPISGISSVSMSNARLQMELLFLDGAADGAALRIMDVFSKYSILSRVRPKNPQGVWDAFLSG